MTDINGRTDTFASPVAFSQGMARYFKLLRQQAELSRQLAVGWAGAMQTMSGIMMTQTSTMGELVVAQTDAMADPAVTTGPAVDPEQDHRRPVLDLIQGSASPDATQRHTSQADWALEQEHLRYNVFDEVFARMLEDDIEEAVV